MRSPLVTVLVPALLAGGLLAAPASAAPPIVCPADDGRERITTDGLTREFEAPAPPAPELAATHDATGDGIRRHRTAHLFLRADFTPYEYGTLAFTLNWTNSSDYDLHVFDGEGNEIGVSNASNIDGGDTKFEAVDVAEIPHCGDLTVEVRNWAGRPDELLRLGIAFKDPGPLLACALDDPAPGCAGKEEGEPPVRILDTRTRLYLGGDRPGQLSMQGHYVFGVPSAGAPPLKASLAPTRPAGGRTNSFTKTAGGNPEQHENPFMANYSYPVTQPTLIKGDVRALLWVSSQTFPQGGGPLFVDLWADGTAALAGTKLARVEVPGTAIGAIPTPVRVTFTGMDAVIESELVLQVSSEPVATSAGVLGDPNDAEWTIYYDSVQFASHLTLDPPTAAPVE